MTQNRRLGRARVLRSRPRSWSVEVNMNPSRFASIAIAILVGALVVAPYGVCPAEAQAIAPACVSDGTGGVVVAWEDSRNGERNIFAQRLTVAGARAWGDTGVAICVAPGDQLAPAIAPDGAGGAVIAWYDLRSGNRDIYAQRVDAAGGRE